MKKNWNELGYEEKCLMIRQIDETYNFAEMAVGMTAKEIAEEVRMNYENDTEWFDFVIEDLDGFEDEMASMIEEIYEEVYESLKALKDEYYNAYLKAMNEVQGIFDRVQEEDEYYERVQELVDGQYPELAGAFMIWPGDCIEVEDKQAVATYLNNLKK